MTKHGAGAYRGPSDRTRMTGKVRVVQHGGSCEVAGRSWSHFFGKATRSRLLNA